MSVQCGRFHMVAGAVMIATASSAASQAKEASSPIVDAIDACRRISVDAQRLACFDSATQRLIAARTSGQIAVVEREQIRKARRSLFGFSVADLPFLSGKRDKHEEDVPKELISSLESFGSQGNGRYRFTIADGNAQWETTESAMLSDPNKGDRVTLRRGALGSFFAQIGNQRWVRARRVR